MGQSGQSRAGARRQGEWGGGSSHVTFILHPSHLLRQLSFIFDIIMTWMFVKRMSILRGEKEEDLTMSLKRSIWTLILLLTAYILTLIMSSLHISYRTKCLKWSSNMVASWGLIFSKADKSFKLTQTAITRGNTLYFKT